MRLLKLILNLFYSQITIAIQISHENSSSIIYGIMTNRFQDKTQSYKFASVFNDTKFRKDTYLNSKQGKENELVFRSQHQSTSHFLIFYMFFNIL